MNKTNEKTDGICILSFDNGGPGTYSQLLILKEYMGRLASDSQVDEDRVYPADHFDLIGGVGFGGLVAIMFGHLRMNVDEAIEELLNITDLLYFDESTGGIDREKNSTILRQALEDMLQARGVGPETKMNGPSSSTQTSKIALFAAASTNVTHPHVFRTYPFRGSPLTPTIVEALCATMAIQSHFLPVKLGSRRAQESFIGGALGANNPTRLLLEEAGKVFGKERRVAQIISLGCGLPRVLSVSSSSTTDINRLLKEISTDCETVASELSTRLLNIDAYLRLNVNRGMDSLEMKEWNSLGAVGTHTATYLATASVSESVDNSLWRLRARVGSVTLGQLTHSNSIKSIPRKAPPVSPYFVLREQPWRTMVNHLVTSISTRQKIFSITGMGGCGKTQLVSYFLQEYPTLYAQIIYVDASSSSSIKFDFQTWSRAMGNGHECDTWEDALRILNNLPPGERWILILDNADDLDLDINSFLPRDINITVAITSRNRNLGNLSTTTHLELGEMTIVEALSTIMQAARRRLPLPADEVDSLRIILKELGYLAVALVQAGTYCHQLSSTVGEVFHPYTFTRYLSLFKSHRADLMKKAEPASLDNYRRGVYTALNLSYNALTQESRDLVHLISFFHHAEIPLAAFSWAARHGFRDPGEHLPRDEMHGVTISNLHLTLCTKLEWNELRLQEIIQTLRSYSLVMTSSSDTCFFLHLHPLVQAWLRDMHPVTTQQYRAMAIQVVTTCGGEKNFELNRLLLPHILDIMKSVDPQNLHVNDLVAFGQTLRQQGYFQKSEELFQMALELMNDSAQAAYISILEVTFQLALSYSDQGRWKEAEKLQIDVVEQRSRILGTEHPDTICAVSYLAETYSHEGRWSEAEQLKLKVLEQRRRLFGIEHPDTIFAVADLAVTYQNQGRWSESEKLEVEVLEQRRRILGVEHPDTLLAAANLAGTYQNQGRWRESEKLEVEVLEQRKRILGTEHPDTLLAAANLAGTYQNQGRWSESEKLEVGVLEQRRRILGVEHPDTIRAAANLAATYQGHGRWNESEKLEMEVLEQRRRILGVEHPDTIRATANLAATYQGQGRWNESEKLGVEVLKQRKRILGIEHPDTILAASNLTITYQHQGRWNESEKLAVEVLKQQRRALGLEHPNTIRAAVNLAATYGAQGRWEENAALLAPAAQLGIKVLGQRHPDTQAYLSELAFVYEKLGKIREAEKTKKCFDTGYGFHGR